eukprot:8783712-Pyramimonas_sp.AAC.1
MRISADAPGPSTMGLHEPGHQVAQAQPLANLCSVEGGVERRVARGPPLGRSWGRWRGGPEGLRSPQQASLGPRRAAVEESQNAHPETP